MVFYVVGPYRREKRWGTEYGAESEKALIRLIWILVWIELRRAGLECNSQLADWLRWEKAQQEVTQEFLDFWFSIKLRAWSRVAVSVGDKANTSFNDVAVKHFEGYYRVDPALGELFDQFFAPGVIPYLTNQQAAVCRLSSFDGTSLAYNKGRKAQIFA